MIRLRAADMVDLALQIGTEIKLVKATLHRRPDGYHRLVVTLEPRVQLRADSELRVRGERYCKPQPVRRGWDVSSAEAARNAKRCMWSFLREDE